MTIVLIAIIKIELLNSEPGFSCTFWPDFVVDAYRLPLAARAHILATNHRMLINKARDVSSQAQASVPTIRNCNPKTRRVFSLYKTATEVAKRRGL